MGDPYWHMLISEDDDFAPDGQQVVAFLHGLDELCSAPQQATLRLGTLSGEVWTGLSPQTRKEISFPRRKFSQLESIADITDQVSGVEDFIVLWSGSGPPKNPLFPLFVATDLEKALVDEKAGAQYEFKQPYAYQITCCVRPRPVALSDPHEVAPVNVEIPPFNVPCEAANRTGYFCNPCADTLVEVPNAGRARFWVEFEFGNWLFPLIRKNLDLLPAPVLECAHKAFATRFVQGCHW
jgi:hypothetical protein